MLIHRIWMEEKLSVLTKKENIRDTCIALSGFGMLNRVEREMRDRAAMLVDNWNLHKVTRLVTRL